jgi:hypothetical protein
MNCATLPALSFGVFDHLDHAGASLPQQYSDRSEIAAGCDAAGFPNAARIFPFGGTRPPLLCTAGSRIDPQR